MAVASIFALDAQATPVNHEFKPIGPDSKGVFWFEDTTPNGATSPLGSWRISMEMRRPAATAAPGTTSAGRTNRVIVGLHQPVLETLGTSTVSGIAPAPTLAYTPRVIAEFILPERATLAQRKDSRKMIALILADAQVIAFVEAFQRLY